MPRCKRRAELVKPKVLWIQPGALGNIFQELQEVRVRLAAGGWEQEIAVLVGRSLPRFHTSWSRMPAIRKNSRSFAERLLAVIDVHLQNHGNVVLQSQALREMIREALDGKD